MSDKLRARLSFVSLKPAPMNLSRFVTYIGHNANYFLSNRDHKSLIIRPKTPEPRSITNS
jgi:hypothetical protein